MSQTPNSGSMTYKLDGLCSDDRDIDCLKETSLLRVIKFFEKMPKQKSTSQHITFFRSKTYEGLFFPFPLSSSFFRLKQREREIERLLQWCSLIFPTFCIYIFTGKVLKYELSTKPTILFGKSQFSYNANLSMRKFLFFQN